MGIARPVMEVYPLAWLFFVPFILVATFTMLNLFIAIIVNTMQSMHDAEMKSEQQAIEAAVHEESLLVSQELRALREEIRTLKASLKASCS